MLAAACCWLLLKRAEGVDILATHGAAGNRPPTHTEIGAYWPILTCDADARSMLSKPGHNCNVPNTNRSGSALVKANLGREDGGVGAAPCSTN